MSSSRLVPSCAAVCLVGLACNEVHIVPLGGSGAEAPSIGGHASDGGFGGDSGVGGDGAFTVGGSNVGGAPEPGVVPGCETLELTGEPFFIATAPKAPPFDDDVSLAALEGDRAGLVYRTGWSQQAELRSRTIEDAFSSWPPVVSDAATQFEGDIVNRFFLASALPNGLFSMGFGVRGIFSFDEPGIVRAAEDDWREMFVRDDIASGFGVFSFDSNAMSYSFLSFDSLDATLPSSSLALPMTGCRTARATRRADGAALFSLASNYYCTDTPRVDFVKESGGLVEAVEGFDLPKAPGQQSLAPRPGGYWYFTSSQYPGVGSYAYRLDENGALDGAPWHDEYTFGDFEPQFLPWRNGFVGSHRDGSLSVFVTDGENRTDSMPIPGTDAMQGLASRTPMAMLVGGEDEGAIFVAYPTMSGILLARLECRPPLK